jgi:hypothetical protein
VREEGSCWDERGGGEVVRGITVWSGRDEWKNESWWGDTGAKGRNPGGSLQEGRQQEGGRKTARGSRMGLGFGRGCLLGRLARTSLLLIFFKTNFFYCFSVFLNHSYKDFSSGIKQRKKGYYLK